VVVIISAAASCSNGGCLAPWRRSATGSGLRPAWKSKSALPNGLALNLRYRACDRSHGLGRPATLSTGASGRSCAADCPNPGRRGCREDIKENRKTKHSRIAAPPPLIAAKKVARRVIDPIADRHLARTDERGWPRVHAKNQAIPRDDPNHSGKSQGAIHRSPGDARLAW
jgi:hypothetical protein